MGYTKRQRSWFKRVYHNRCQFPIYTEKRGFRTCGLEDRIQIHHIEPQRYSKSILKRDPDRMYNGVALCEMHHVGKETKGPILNSLENVVAVVHNDIRWAFRNYSATDGESFKRVLERREELLKEGIIYWNKDYDEFFQERNYYMITQHLLKYPEDLFPCKSRRK
jgi:hypothetical protein